MGNDFITSEVNDERALKLVESFISRFMQPGKTFRHVRDFRVIAEEINQDTYISKKHFLKVLTGLGYELKNTEEPYFLVKARFQPEISNSFKGIGSYDVKVWIERYGKVQNHNNVGNQ